MAKKPPHGLPLYKSKKWACRCRKCKTANATYQRKYRRDNGLTKRILVDVKGFR